MSGSDAAIEAIYAASLDANGWEAAVDRISARFNTATGALYMENREATSLLSPGVLTGHSTASVAAYGEYFCSLNPFNRKAIRYGGVGTLSDSDLDRRFNTSGLFADGEFFADWVRPQALRHVVGRHVRSTNDSVLCTAFWRPADAGPFSGEDVAEFERIIGHINRAIDIGGRLQTAEAEMELMLERSSAAVFTLGRNGHLRRCNALGEALLASGQALCRRDGRLAATVPQDQPALDRLIACAFDPRRVGWAENARLALRRTDGGPVLTARIAAVTHRFPSFAADLAASAVLTVEGFEAEAALRADRLRRRFGLTPAQVRLAEALRDGQSLPQASLQLGIGHETARSHLKTLFARTDTHRQAELVLLLRDLERF